MEMVWYLKHGEKPQTDMILGRMSEAGICLLTGERENVLAVPVDFNTSNMLPTNMVCLSKTIIEDIVHVLSYKVTCSEELTISLCTPPCLIDYNKTLLSALSEEIPKPKDFNFIEIYEMLMSRHIKGIEKISFTKEDACMSWVQFQRYWFSAIDRMQKKKSKIVTLV